MTFKSLISHSGPTHSTFLDSVYEPSYKDLKREDYSHGWKGSHKGNSALNAITLLAFLFFLNILQSCLRDNLLATQAPIVVVISSESSSNSTTTRTKRSSNTTNEGELMSKNRSIDNINFNDGSQPGKTMEDKENAEQ